MCVVCLHICFSLFVWAQGLDGRYDRFDEKIEKRKRIQLPYAPALRCVGTRASKFASEQKLFVADNAHSYHT